MDKVSSNKKLWDRKVPAELVIFIMFVTTWITYNGKGLVATIPLVIIIPLVLRLFYENGLLIVVTAFISSISIGMIKDDLGYGMLLIPAIVLAAFSGVMTAKGIKNEDKKKRIIFTGIGVAAIILTYINYIEMWGDPVSYLKAKSSIQAYIDKTYEGQLEIEGMKRSFLKMSGYYAEVVQKENVRNRSRIYYDDNSSIMDHYHDETSGNMMEEVTRLLTSLVINQTDLTDYDISLYAKVEVPLAKYELHDSFSGDEPINVDVQLQPNFSWKRKAHEEIKTKVYIDKEAFAEDAFKVITVLQNAGYLYKEVRIYYYLQDGNTTYEVILKDGETVNSFQELNEYVQKVNYSK
ncbi:MAG: hypothetical protein K0S71_255 [Clostridia bacterium]|jgi:hypothetical protein|nr:hypothetical protein [Clostridia bacterium]